MKKSVLTLAVAALAIFMTAAPAEARDRHDDNRGRHIHKVHKYDHKKHHSYKKHRPVVKQKVVYVPRYYHPPVRYVYIPYGHAKQVAYYRPAPRPSSPSFWMGIW